MTIDRRVTPAVARLMAAGLVVVGGVVHLSLWRGGYRGIPAIGPLFLVNVVVSGLIAARLLFGGGRLTVIAGMAVAAGSLVALVLSRTVGLLGFMEATWTPRAAQAVAAEVGAVVSLALVLTVGKRRDDDGRLGGRIPLPS